MKQKGIAELIAESIDMLPEEIRPVVLRNIYLTGGSSQIPGLFDRFVSEVRQNFNSNFRISFRHEPSEMFYVDSMSKASRGDGFTAQVITKKTYEEFGSYALVHALNL